MNFPLDIYIGKVIIPIHLVTDILAFYFSYRFYEYLRRKNGDYISDSSRLMVLVGAALGALIGSRFLAALEHLELFLNPPTVLYYYANKSIVGGIVGAIIGVEITKKFVKQKSSTGDLFTFPLILGMIIGRVGCFLTGVSDGTVGNPSDLPWAFNQGDGIARHPTSLYEIIFLIAIYYLLKNISNKTPLKNGILFRLFIVLYLSFRFVIEFIKPVERIYLGLSSIQIACLFFVIYYLYSLLFVYKYRPFTSRKI